MVTTYDADKETGSPRHPDLDLASPLGSIDDRQRTIVAYFPCRYQRLCMNPITRYLNNNIEEALHDQPLTVVGSGFMV